MAGGSPRTRYTYHYIPREGEGRRGYCVPGGVAPAPAPAPAPAAQQPALVPYHYFLHGPSQAQCTYYYPPQNYYYASAPVSAPAPVPVIQNRYPAQLPPPANGTYTYTYAAHASPSQPKAVDAPAIPTSYYCGRTKEEVEMDTRKLAAARGAYQPRRIKPADAEPDELFWCLEKDGDWQLRTFYNIENDCQPGRWTMDAKEGYLVFERQ